MSQVCFYPKLSPERTREIAMMGVKARQNRLNMKMDGDGKRLTVKASKSRIVTFSMNGDALITCERVAYLPTGYSRRKWNESRVALTVPELEAALAFAKARGDAA